MKTRTLTDSLQHLGKSLQGYVEIKKNRFWHSVHWSIYSLDNFGEVSDLFGYEATQPKPDFSQQVLKIIQSGPPVAKGHHYQFSNRWGKITGLPLETCLKIQAFILARWNLIIARWNTCNPNLPGGHWNSVSFLGGPLDGSSSSLGQNVLVKIQPDNILNLYQGRYQISRSGQDQDEIKYTATYLPILHPK